MSVAFLNGVHFKGESQVEAWLLTKGVGGGEGSLTDLQFFSGEAGAGTRQKWVKSIFQGRADTLEDAMEK